MSVLEAINKLTAKLSYMENKLDKFVGDLGAVCTKMDLVVTSIGLVQQEQVQIAKLLQSRAADSHPDTVVANVFEGFDQGPSDLAPARVGAGLEEDPLLDEELVQAAAESSSDKEFVFDSNVAAPASSIDAPITCSTEFPTTVVDSALALVPRSLQFTRSEDTGVLDPICRGVNTYCSSIRDRGELFLVHFELLLHVHAFSTPYFVKHQSAIPHSVATDVCESKFWDPGLPRGLGFKEFGMTRWVVSSCAEFHWDPGSPDDLYFIEFIRSGPDFIKGWQRSWDPGLPVVITRSGADNYPASIHWLATNWLTQRKCGSYWLSLLQMHQLVALGTYVTLPVLACGELYHIAWQLQLVDYALSNIACLYIACDSEFIPAPEVIWALGTMYAAFKEFDGLMLVFTLQQLSVALFSECSWGCVMLSGYVLKLSQVPLTTIGSIHVHVCSQGTKKYNMGNVTSLLSVDGSAAMGQQRSSLVVRICDIDQTCTPLEVLPSWSNSLVVQMVNSALVVINHQWFNATWEIQVYQRFSQFEMFLIWHFELQYLQKHLDYHGLPYAQLQVAVSYWCTDITFRALLLGISAYRVSLLIEGIEKHDHWCPVKQVLEFWWLIQWQLNLYKCLSGVANSVLKGERMQYKSRIWIFACEGRMIVVYNFWIGLVCLQQQRAKVSCPGLVQGLEVPDSSGQVVSLGLAEGFLQSNNAWQFENWVLSDKLPMPKDLSNNGDVSLQNCWINHGDCTILQALIKCPDSSTSLAYLMDMTAVEPAVY